MTRWASRRQWQWLARVVGRPIVCVCRGRAYLCVVVCPCMEIQDGRLAHCLECRYIALQEEIDLEAELGVELGAGHHDDGEDDKGELERVRCARRQACVFRPVGPESNPCACPQPTCTHAEDEAKPEPATVERPAAPAPKASEADKQLSKKVRAGQAAGLGS